MPTMTLENLAALSISQRFQLYQNARRALARGGPNSAKASEMVELIETSGLPYYSGGGLTNEDPIFLKMTEIVYSAAGKQAAIEATESGLPALCGVDRLLKEALGANYGKHDLGTASAGDLVAKLMRQLGYKETGTGKCPPGCVAKTGLKWAPKKRTTLFPPRGP